MIRASCQDTSWAHCAGIYMLIPWALPKIFWPQLYHKDFSLLRVLIVLALWWWVGSRLIRVRLSHIGDKLSFSCSTRNFNLNKNQFKTASNIYRYLFKLKKKISKNYKFFKVSNIKKDLITLGADKIDYIENINVKNLKRIKKSKNNFKIFIAYHIKNIRLIDNI